MLCLLTAVLTPTQSARAGDWPQYRGANHDGTSLDRVNKHWSGSVTNPLWLIPLTNGPSGLAVSGGCIFTQIRRNIAGTDKEVCVALSTLDGSELWATPVDDAVYPNGGIGPDDGPRSTPSVVGGSVYVLTSYLKLYRLNATNGTALWTNNLVDNYAATVIEFQNGASPLVDGGMVYVNANCGTSTLMALSTNDGSLVWRSQNEALTHSTPTLATIHGVRQLLFATQSGLTSLDPASGTLLWHFNYPFTFFIAIGSSPVVWQDLVFGNGAHAYGMGSFVMQATLTNNSWATTLLWYTNITAAHWMTPIARQGSLYGQFGIQYYDSAHAQLTCIDMRSGAVKWAMPEFGRGSTMLVDDTIVSLTETGDLVLVLASTNAYTELGRFQAIPNYDLFTNRCWNFPAVADGRIYVRSSAFAAAYDLSVPSLKLDPPQPAGPNKFQLTARTVDGSPVNENRLPTMELHATTNLALSLSNWPRLTNTFFLTNGLAQTTNVDSGTFTRRFFIIREP